jgi:phosphate transport system permease protein
VAFAPKGDGAALAGAGWLLPLEVENAHPEAGLRAFFSKIWYEDSPSPEWVWQSTGGTDEFEPKLSLTPLVFGTLKATLYALIFAVPLGILGATCSSQFLAPALQSLVKPTVELMASLPSVVLGFLGGLWLAPRLERVFPGLLLMIIALPLLSILTGGLWRALPRRLSGRLPEGGELFFYALVLLLGMVACIELSAPFEALAFSGDFSSWLQQATGLGYDQRNAVVAGIAMGFAVIPIIFAISDDALSNVPANLSAASLALGATRWQTVARIVLPAASPGIFAAVMIGLGRAVGETMIVLMATGNTPVLDWNAFNGFRTLSANIAVEIPEAPQGGTLYRTLFLSAVLLFAVTFLINTAAELVRERIRRRFAGQG